MRDGNIQISISQPSQTRHVWIFNGGGEGFVIGKGVAWDMEAIIAGGTVRI